MQLPDASSSGSGRQIQTQLNFNPQSSTLSTWQYNAHVAREEITRFIVATDSPICLSENPFFVNMVKTAFCPAYTPVSRSTSRRDILKLYNKINNKLKNEFQNFGNISIALTSDIWACRSKTDFLTVTVHFLEHHWGLQQKLIGFKPLYEKHSAETIYFTILEVLQEYLLTDRVVALTLDNTAANTVTISLFEMKLDPLGEGKFYHQRCACHIINLIVKAGLDAIHSKMEKVRRAIGFIVGGSNKRWQEYVKYCNQEDPPVRPLKLCTDMPIRWNSTYLMLEKALPTAK